MNVVWRTLIVLFRARWLLRRAGAVPATSVGRVRVRTLPTDIDLLGHMNNGRYLSLFDLGRWDLMVRTGLLDAMRAQGWYAVVAAETVTFRVSLKLWQRFVIETRVVGHDDRAVLLEHRAVVGGEIAARAFIRARFLRRSGGTVPHDELFEIFGRPEDLPGVPDWVAEWAERTALPSRRKSAPSLWS